MDEINANLLRKSAHAYYTRTVLAGIKILAELNKQIRFLILPVLIWSVTAILCLHTPNTSSDLRTAVVPIYVLVGIVATVAALYIVGHIPGGHIIYDNLIRAGIVNKAYEVPVPIAIYKDGANGISITFYSKGFPLEMWTDTEQLPLIATALSLEILSAKPGKCNQKVMIFGVSSKGALPEQISWRDRYLPAEQSALALGQSAAGPVTIDLAQTPHLLIGAATGQGKTLLLKLLLQQMILRGFVIHVVDRKGLVDYNPYFRQHCTFTETDDALLETISAFHCELNRRKSVLTEDETAVNITEYNTANPNDPWPRWVLVIDEASMVMDASGLDVAAKKTKQELVRGLCDIGRLGRAFGMHLIVCTQRSSVDSVPVALKAQLDGRAK